MDFKRLAAFFIPLQLGHQLLYSLPGYLRQINASSVQPLVSRAYIFIFVTRLTVTTPRVYVAREHVLGSFAFFPSPPSPAQNCEGFIFHCAASFYFITAYLGNFVSPFSLRLLCCISRIRSYPRNFISPAEWKRTRRAIKV